MNICNTEGEKNSVQSWCFTINNYTEEIYQQFISQESIYTVCGREICPTTGTPHLQGYVYFATKKSFKQLKKLYPTANFRNANGTPEQASMYCKKSDKDYFEKGDCPRQGKRSDLDDVRQVIANGGGMRQVVDITTSYQSVKMAEQILKYKEKPRNWECDVFWFYGKTDTGKSRAAFELAGEDAYPCLSTGKWFDGYDAHEDVVIDDMRRDFCKFHELLRLLDRYPYRVETKGGTRQFKPKRIYITSPYPPQELFETREDLGQLLRRIKQIKEFN